MSRDLVTIATWPNTEEAHAAKNFLEASGIRAVLADETVVGNYWHLANAIGGVKLLVTRDDAPRALQLLDEIEEQSQDAKATAPWHCPKCGERVPGAFDVCWKCGAERELDESSTLAPGLGPIVDSPVAERPPGEPRTPVSEPLEEEHAETAEDVVRRAWFASVLGIIVCPGPLLNLYSMWLLLGVNEGNAQLSPKARRWYRASWWINGIVVVLAALIWLAIWKAAHPTPFGGMEPPDWFGRSRPH